MMSGSGSTGMCRRPTDWGHLLHLTSDGVLFADGASATVAGWEREARAGSWGVIPGHFVRGPWAGVALMELSDGLTVVFHYAEPGAVGQTVTFEATSDAQRDEIAERLRLVGGRRETQRRQSPFEIVRTPGGILASVLLVVAVLAWFVGHEGGGASRRGARAALITSVANTLGYGGIGAIAVVSTLALGGFIVFRLRPPPVVHRLERA